jgi:ABC-type Zn uptake system ZnuABC Zn-binding protein ZnuA
MRRIVAVVAAAALGMAACAPAGRDSGGDDRLVVVATTSVFADLVAQVGRERVDVRALVPAGGEPHTFDPSPSDVTRLEDAALVVQNGLGLDDWLGGLVTDAGTEAPIVVLGEHLEGVQYRSAGDDAHEGTEGHPRESGHAAEGAIDPHLWLNVAYAALYVERIADALAEADPPEADVYAANADALLAELGELDRYARETLGAIPASRRKVVSFHEAFGYFADAYGLTIVDTVVDAPGQEPSAGAVAALIDEIERTGATAILAEAQFPTDLVDRIAEETGATVVADLHSDSLGPRPADTFVGMLRADVDAIAAALR